MLGSVILLSGNATMIGLCVIIGQNQTVKWHLQGG